MGRDFIGTSKPSVDIRKEIKQAENHDFILIISRRGMGRTFTANYLHEKFWENKETKPRIEEIVAKDAEPILEKYLEGSESCTLCINEAHGLTVNAQELLINYFKNEHKNNVKVILASNVKIKCEDNILYSNYFCNNPTAVIKIPSLHERGINDIEQFIQYFVKEQGAKHNKAYIISDKAWTVFRDHNYEFISLYDLQKKIEELCLYSEHPDEHETISDENVGIVLKKRFFTSSEEYDEDIDFWEQKNQQLNRDIKKYKKHLKDLRLICGFLSVLITAIVFFHVAEHWNEPKEISHYVLSVLGLASAVWGLCKIIIQQRVGEKT